jgi:hypothetical protein
MFEATQRETQSDDCINNDAPPYAAERSFYDNDGDFSPALIEVDVSSGTATSTVRLDPSTTTYFSASNLTISPSTGTSKFDLGSGSIEVAFTNPSNTCDQSVWQLSFGSGLTTTLVVKIRKTRIEPTGDE